MTWDTISVHFVTDIGENADIGGGNNPDASLSSTESDSVELRLAAAPVPQLQRGASAAIAACRNCSVPANGFHAPFLKEEDMPSFKLEKSSLDLNIMMLASLCATYILET